MKRYAEEELAELRTPAAGSANASWKTSCWPRARITTASSWKSAPAPAATRRPCSPAISTTCTPTTPAIRAGRSKRSPSAPASKAATRKSSSASPATSLSASALRERRPSRAARAQDRDAGPHPHLGGHGGRHARARRSAGRDQASRTSSGNACAPAARAASTSTRPKAPSASGTRRARPTSWKSSARTSAASTRTTTGPCASCAAGSTNGSSRRCTEARAEQRRTLIGSGDRSERIRTYNFPQNRVTDHRINLTLYKLDAIIAGDLGELIQALRDFDRRQRLGQQPGNGVAGSMTDV